MAGIIFLIAWIILSYVFAAIAPTVFAGILYAIEFLCLCLWTALRIVLRAAGRGLLVFIGLAYRGLCNAALFAWLLIAEWRHGPDDDFAQDDAHAGESEAETDRYEQALALFDLESGFTREALSRAYKRLMVKVHPDLPGGSVQAAQEANAARDLLMRTHG
jgi:hypothetical protein